MDPMMYEAAMNGEGSNLTPNMTSQESENLNNLPSQSQLSPNHMIRCSIFMDPKLYEASVNGDVNFLHNMTSQETWNLASQLTPSKDTVLHVATEFHQTQFVTRLMAGCPLLLSQANSFGDTALHIAARQNFPEIINIFINQRADVETGQYREFVRMVNLNGDTALHCAARRGCYESIKLLVKADPELCSFVNNANESPLYLSVASKYVDVAELIIKAAPPTAPHTGPNGLTALHPTVKLYQYPLKKIELLVKWRRQMISERDLLGYTPLHYAALYGRSEAIKLFLQYDDSAIQVLDSQGVSALHLAAFRGHVKVLQELINCHPDSCYLTDNKGRTILHAAVLGDRRKVVEFVLETPRLARLINQPDKDGNVPLHLATVFKLYAVIEILAKNKNVSLYIVNKDLMTPVDVLKKSEVGLKYSVARSLLKNSRGMVKRQQLADAQVKKMNKSVPTPNNTETTRENVNKENSDPSKQNALDINLLVATLVATVTFTAGFTMPGGYVDNGPEEGLATLTTKAAFQMFVVFNTLAFSCSVLAVLLQLHTSVDQLNRVRYMWIAVGFTNISIIGMIMAYSSGTYVILTQSTQLSIVPFLICGCFTLLFFAIFVADPGALGFPLLGKFQNYVRDKIIRHVSLEMLSQVSELQQTS